MKDRPVIGVEQDLYQLQFHYFMALAQYLTKGKDKCILLNYSPDLIKHPALQYLGCTLWKYEVESNDFVGLGIDKGFQRTGQYDEKQIRFFALDNLLLLEKLPEDSFGDETSQISIFGFKDGTIDMNIFSQVVKPRLENLLKTDDLFIHLGISKSMGQHHSLLIKSRTDIEHDINAFQYVISPDN